MAPEWRWRRMALADDDPLAEAVDHLRRFRAKPGLGDLIDAQSGLTLADLDVVLAQAQKALPPPYAGRERRKQWHDWAPDGSLVPPASAEFVDIFYDSDGTFETMRADTVDWYGRGRPPLRWRRSRGPVRRRGDV